ncbi:ABC transporter permease [Candidatus Zixiibacteriota bacterium]
MSSILQDIRFGIRMLLRTPLFTIASILCLGLGIGAVASLFPFFYEFLIDPLPYERSKELVAVYQTNLERGFYSLGGNYLDFNEWRDQNHSFADICAADWSRFTLTGVGEPVQVETYAVSAEYFDVFGTQPMLGRGITRDDEVPGAPLVAVLSHRFWQSRFNGDAGVLGTSILLGGRPFSVVGVMPEGFEDPGNVLLWTGLQEFEGMARGEFAFFLDVTGRLKPGVSIEDAQREMDGLALRLAEEFPDSNDGVGVRLRSLQLDLTEDYREPVTIFLCVVIFVLLLACANVANLLLARAAVREREIAVRVSLGAGRKRVLRQLLTESVLLAMIGGALGIMLGSIGRDLIVRYIPEEIPHYLEFALNGWVLLILLLLTALCGILFGMAPAMSTARGNIHQVLIEGSGRGSGSSRLSGFRSFLVVFEICLAMVVLTGAGLMMKGFLRLYDVDPGFDPDNKLTLRLDLPEAGYETFGQQNALFKEALQRIRLIPGVTAASLNSHLPMSRSNWRAVITVGGTEPPPENQPWVANRRVISNDYFETMDIPLTRGRFFGEQDRSNSRRVMIVNQQLADAFWPEEDPIGKLIAFGSEPAPEEWFEIVGVVGDVRQSGLNRPIFWCVYLFMDQVLTNRNYLVANTMSDPLEMAIPVRDAIWSVDANLPISDIFTFPQMMRRTNWEEPLYTMLFGIFSVISLLLATVGVYGVIAYSVTQRTREFGIRMALGADGPMVQRLVVGKGLLLGGIGLIIGLVAAFFLMSFMESMLYGVRNNDVMIYAITAVLMSAVALMASWLPARRAARVDPVESLRVE